jgi:hypothetical protein
MFPEIHHVMLKKSMKYNKATEQNTSMDAMIHIA